MAIARGVTYNFEGKLRLLEVKHLPRKMMPLLLTGQPISRCKYRFSTRSEYNVQITRLKVIIDAGSLV